MTKNKTLLLVTNTTLLEKLKEESNITFLFPITDFCVGFPTTFQVEDIKIEAYIFINRIFDNEGISKVKDFLLNLPPNIKGIVFDDIGVLNVLITLNLNLTKILFLNHLNCNYESINCYLEYVDSVVISTDITKEETQEILTQAKKPLVIYTFGHVNIMYSRRTLITNYNNHFHKSLKKTALISEVTSRKNLRLIENKYGTVIYTEKPFNNLNMRGLNNVLYELINPIFLSDEEVINILKCNTNLEEKYPYKYLSEIKTIFKLKGGEQ